MQADRLIKSFVGDVDLSPSGRRMWEFRRIPTQQIGPYSNTANRNINRSNRIYFLLYSPVCIKYLNGDLLSYPRFHQSPDW